MNVFHAILGRESGLADGRPVVPRVVTLESLVQRYPQLANGVLLGFSEGAGDLLFLRANGREVWLDFFFVSARANMELLKSVLVGKLDGQESLSEMDVTVYEQHDLFCVILSKQSCSVFQVCLFEAGSGDSSMATLSSTQTPTVEIPGKNLVYLCVGSDIYVWRLDLRMDFDGQAEDLFTHHVVMCRDWDLRSIRPCLRMLVVIEDLAGRVAKNLRSLPGFPSATLDDFYTALLPCDGSGDLLFCVTLQVRVACSDGLPVFVWVRARHRPGEAVQICEAKTVRVQQQQQQRRQVHLSALSASLMRKEMGAGLIATTKISGSYGAHQEASAAVLSNSKHAFHIKL